jgi:hypothetical protein
LLAAGLPALSGKRLRCHCGSGEPCHADILVEEFAAAPRKRPDGQRNVSLTSPPTTLETGPADHRRLQAAVGDPSRSAGAIAAGDPAAGRPPTALEVHAAAGRAEAAMAGPEPMSTALPPEEPRTGGMAVPAGWVGNGEPLMVGRGPYRRAIRDGFGFMLAGAVVAGTAEPPGHSRPHCPSRGLRLGDQEPAGHHPPRAVGLRTGGSEPLSPRRRPSGSGGPP